MNTNDTARPPRIGGRLRSESTSQTDRVVYPLLEYARMACIGRTKAYALARTGEIPTLRIGERLYVPASEVERVRAGDAA